MAQQPPAIEFENILFDEARRMIRGHRIASELYHAFRQKIQSLDNAATHLVLPEGTSLTTMKNRIFRTRPGAADADVDSPARQRQALGGLGR